ncbi:hypothetical protein BB560_002640 [Smittium megazygosporum]|uniref:Uncharacterized protein n=1 Tax=Smittium megazygosporum TaxID=133381 RepID=A0A2T9ZE79_9FUNG|nr:hypothetical protein BB560_002640 [Smittium megazygosporum]
MVKEMDILDDILKDNDSSIINEHNNYSSYTKIAKDSESENHSGDSDDSEDSDRTQNSVCQTNFSEKEIDGIPSDLIIEANDVNNIIMDSAILEKDKIANLEKVLKIHNEHVVSKIEKNQEYYCGINIFNIEHQSTGASLRSFSRAQLFQLSRKNVIDKSTIKRIFNTYLIPDSRNKSPPFSLNQLIKKYISDTRNYTPESTFYLTNISIELSTILKDNALKICENIDRYQIDATSLVNEMKTSETRYSSVYPDCRLDCLLSILRVYVDFFVSYVYKHSSDPTNGSSSFLKQGNRTRSKGTRNELFGISFDEIVSFVMVFILFLLEHRMVSHVYSIKKMLEEIVNIIPEPEWNKISYTLYKRLTAFYHKLHVDNKLLLVFELLPKEHRFSRITADICYNEVISTYSKKKAASKFYFISPDKRDPTCFDISSKRFELYLQNLVETLDSKIEFSIFNKGGLGSSSKTDLKVENESRNLLLFIKCFSFLLSPSLLLQNSVSNGSSQGLYNNPLFPYLKQSSQNDQDTKKSYMLSNTLTLQLFTSIHSKLGSLYRRINKSHYKDLSFLKCKDSLHLLLMWLPMTWLHNKEFHPVYLK